MAGIEFRYVADIVRERAATMPDAVAQIFEDKKTTYGALDSLSNQVAQGLIADDVKPDGRIGYMGRNNDLYFELLIGAFKARAVVVGVNWRLAAPEVAYVLNDSKTEILYVTEDFYSLIESIQDQCPALRKIIAIEGGHTSWPSFEEWRDQFPAEDPKLAHEDQDDVIQLYTSGTTGHPKGVQITNSNYRSIAEQASSGMWPEWHEGEVNLVAMPLFHVAGVNIGVLGFYSGCTNVILKDVDPQEIFRLIETYKVNVAFVVPAVIMFMCQHPNARDVDFSSLRIVLYGASPIAEEVLLEAQDLFKCGFVQLYGLTETTGAGASLSPEDHDPARGKLRSCGKPAPAIDIKIFDDTGKEVPQGDVGEIVIRSDVVMKGYWNRPEATEEAVVDNWFHTGDAGYFDEEGYLYIHDRVKDMIVSGGENIYPAEVENALFGHPAVADAAVIGIPDDKWGEAVKGIVVLKPDVEATEADIIAYVRENIATYKTPKSIDFIEALPRNPSGKILRRELREPCWEGRDRKVG